MLKARPARRIPGPSAFLMLFNEGRDSPATSRCNRRFRRNCRNSARTRLISLKSISMPAIFRPGKLPAVSKLPGRKIYRAASDLIVVFPSGDYALAGALPEALFPDVPVVFVTVNELEVPYAISKLGVTGIVQRFDLRGTLA